MKRQEIEITISPTGEVSFTVKGIKGQSCVDETKFLEQALGGAVLEQERTSEYYEDGDASHASVWASDDEGDG